MIADHAIGEHRERVRVVATEDADAEDPEATATINVVDEHEFTAVGVRLLEVRKLPCLRAVNFGCLFVVLGSWCFVRCKSASNHQRRTNKQEP